MTALLGGVRRLIEELGYTLVLAFESVYWLIAGRSQGQPVRLSAVVAQMVEAGVKAFPIVAMLAFAVGVSLAIQLIATLSEFGAQSQVVLAIAKGVTREFAPLITGIVVAGRTSSALAARVGSMVVAQEVDALRVMGVMPVRYLAAPPLIALLIMMPILTLFADVVAILGGGLFSIAYLDMSLAAWIAGSLDALTAEDVLQGLAKSVVSGGIVALIGVASGFGVRGGAEGVGEATTRAVVVSISCLVLANMVFTFFLNRL